MSLKSIFKFIRSLFNFREQKKQLLHIILVSFLASFFIARLWATLIGNSIFIRGYQIHHFYFGTIILAFGGVMALLSDGQKNLRIASAMIGVGIGFFADEIGLLLNCTTSHRVCVYAFPDTYDFITSISAIILLILIWVDFKEKSDLKKMSSNKELETK